MFSVLLSGYFSNSRRINIHAPAQQKLKALASEFQITDTHRADARPVFFDSA